VNKTVMFVSLVSFLLIGTIGVIVLLLFRPENVGQLIQLITNLGATIVAAAVTIYGLGKVSDRQDALASEVKTVKAQTNGTLSKLISERDAATAALARHDPILAAQLLGQTGSHPIVETPPRHSAL
jgi:hypothetical protein